MKIKSDIFFFEALYFLCIKFTAIRTIFENGLIGEFAENYWNDESCGKINKERKVN